MRIGIDMLAVQSPGSRLRGIGRYGSNLVSALLGLGGGHEYVLYAHDGFPTEHFPQAPHAETVRLAIEPRRGERFLRDAMGRLARTNPDGLDALLLISPFELCPGYDPPAAPMNGLAVATVMHDLIPFLFQEHYLHDLGNAAWFYRRLRTLRRYDLLLANSDATRDDCLRVMGLGPDRVVTIGGAADGAFFTPDRSLPMPLAARTTLGRLGVTRPYVFCVNGMDDRKNVWGLIDAFRLLPAEVRESHLLVITCFMKPEDERKVRAFIRERGLDDRVVLTGEVTDEELRVLYQRCAAFAFPSLYEGLGLPLLEAMHCEVPVIAGNNSSQIEVVGDGGLLVNASDPADIAEHLGRVLTDRDLAADLGRRGREHAAGFTWARSAERSVEALERVVDRRRRRRLRVDRGHVERPRLAVFSPWPPKASGISDYAVRLVEELKGTYAIDLYHEPGYVPDPALGSADFGAYDYRLFERNARVLGYRGVLHQMGNSWYHGFVYEAIQKYPGIVTLHDFCLSGFQMWHAYTRGDGPRLLREELRYAYPERYGEFEPQVDAWTREPGGFQDAAARRGLHMNRRIFEHARAVVVHSPWCLDQARAMSPEFAGKTVVVPHGSTVAVASPEARAATRARFGLPQDALIVGSFGILTIGKMNVEAIEAFAPLARRDPRALMIFVGHDLEQGLARRHAEALGLADRVRFLGRQPAGDFDELLTVADIGVSLRRPPTYGETSGALLHLLRFGVPTVVNDVGTFSGYPDAVVRKVRMESEGIAGLSQALLDLAADADARAGLGRAAREYVGQYHAWHHAASLYAECIERVFEAREGSRSGLASHALLTPR